MSEPYNLAVIGNGTSAVNIVDALLNEIERTPAAVLPEITVTIYGDGPESACGRGYAHGQGSRVGYLTEMPEAADYASTKGAFRHYAAQQLNRDPNSVTATTRTLVGDFHNDRHFQNKTRALQLGVNIEYRQAYIDDVAETHGGFAISHHGQEIGFADRVVLAIGDVISPAFDNAADHYAGKIFRTPYDAVDTILNDHDENTVIVARGTRSSFVDLVNGLYGEGYKGKIYGYSRSGTTSWQGNHSASYTATHVTPDKEFPTAKSVLLALAAELNVARENGAFVPRELPKMLILRSNGAPYRLQWEFDLDAEAENADKITYHDVVGSIAWDDIIKGIKNDSEREALVKILGDFIVYNRVNRIVPEEYEKFVAHVKTGRVEIRKGDLNQDMIKPAGDRLTFRNYDKQVDGDYFVNCGVGPASSKNQIDKVPLLRRLVHKEWLTASAGTGFIVNGDSKLSMVGVQARAEYGSIGIETNGRQIARLIPDIIQALISHQTQDRDVLFNRRFAHG